MYLFAPVWVEQISCVVRYETPNKLPKGRIRTRLDSAFGPAEMGRQIEGAQRLPDDNAPASPASTLQRPEQFRILVRVDDAHLAVSSDHQRFHEMGRRCAETFREAAEATALHQPRRADRGAPPPCT